MNGNNYNSNSSPYRAQSYNDEYSHDSVEAYDDDIHQEYSQNSGQIGYQMGNTFEYQPEHMYDFNDIGEYQSDYQIDAIQEYSQLESQGYLNNKQLTSGNANITGRQNDPNNREYPQIENRGYTNNNQFNNGNTTGIRQNEAIQEYSQIDNQGYPNNNQYNNGNTNINQFNNANTNTNQYHPNTNIGGMQQNSNMPGSGRNTQAYNSTIAKVYQSQHSNSPLHDPNSFTASSESSFASQPSPKEQLQYLRDPQQQETSQVNGILQMEGSVEPNGPILGGQGYIPAQTVQKAYYELGETPEIKSACLRGFRQQIEIHQEENNFDEHSDAFLLKFLRSRKFDVESAYALLEKYYNVRENKPEVFRNLTRKNVKRTMEQGIVGVLPQRDKKGRAIVIFNFHGWNMSLAFHFEKLLRVFVFTLEKLFESEETQINGMVIISNLAQLSVLQTKNLGATMITKILEIFEGNLPFRLNAIHLLNPPWHFKLLWKMVDPLTKIKPKIARRIFIHDGDLSRFNAEFEPELLPKELGGKCPPYDNTLWVKELLDPEQTQQPHSQKQMQSLQPSMKTRRSPSPARRAVNR